MVPSSWRRQKEALCECLAAGGLSHPVADHDWPYSRAIAVSCRRCGVLEPGVAGAAFRASFWLSCIQATILSGASEVARALIENAVKHGVSPAVPPVHWAGRQSSPLFRVSVISFQKNIRQINCWLQASGTVGPWSACRGGRRLSAGGRTLSNAHRSLGKTGRYPRRLVPA